MEWLRQHTPPPFDAGDTYYYADYDTAGLQPPDYTVLSWWDQGYWITQQARRVPVANPTQERAATAAQFYTAIDEAAASAIAAANRTRYVLADFELPFRRIADGSIMGRFQTIVDWTGKRHDDFYEVAYRREGGQWVPTWLFYEPYYRSMAFRLATLGGKGATPSHATTVVALVSRVDNNGFRFREIVTQETYATYGQAQRMQETLGADAVLAGLDPWQPAFPLEPVSAFTEVFATPVREGDAPYAPRVRVFQVR
jgi:hypothetical protein